MTYLVLELFYLLGRGFNSSGLFLFEHVGLYGELFQILGKFSVEMDDPNIVQNKFEDL